MSSLRIIKRRIKSVSGIKQITKAMEMVSATKFKRAQDRIDRARPYIGKLDAILSDILSSVSSDELTHPLTSSEAVKEPKRAVLVVITSDKGLCGSFNSNLIKKAAGILEEGREKGIEYDLVPVGRRGMEHFRRRRASILRQDLINIDMGLPTPFINSLFEYITSLYTGESQPEGFETYDKIEIVYARFQSAMVHMVERIDLLPLLMGPTVGEEGSFGETKEYIFEPGPVELFNDLIPQVIKMRLFSTLAETITSEHSARMTAMHNATENAGDMIDYLTLQRNKARQSAITTELSDIVGGAEALKG